MAGFHSFVIVAVFAWTLAADAENWHTSQISLRRLYGLQAEQLAAARAYLVSETERLRDLERVYSLVFEWFSSNSYERNTFILNHLNGIQLMKRTHSAQLEIKRLLNNGRSIKELKKFNENKAVNERNIRAVYRSIRRLQTVYGIPASDMATGKHKNRTIGDPLNACECYIMVKTGFDNSDPYGIIYWAVQAYKKWLVDRPACVDMDKLLYYMKTTSMITGYSFESLPNIQELHHSKSSKVVEQFISLMAKELSVREVNSELNLYETYDKFDKPDAFMQFVNLCKTGESKRPPTTDFKCRYQTKNDLYRIIMPFKEEDISHNPYLKLYHDIIFEEEISSIIDLAEKDLSDAAYYLNGKISVLDDRRLGQLKWFSENANPKVFNKLNDRVECLTGFSTKTAEGYQTVNYGAGGHFSLHVDAFSDGPKEHGNRLITVLFYMTDVVDNGYTVFPNINYVAHCRKGTAMIWRNLYSNNGTVHSGTFHGGCPVLKGNKWIMTKGLYEGGQALTYDWKANKRVIIV